MRLSPSIPFVIAVLFTLSLTFPLPILDAIRSTWRRHTLSFRRNWFSQIEVPTIDEVPHHYAHLHKRKAEIYELEKRQQVNCTDPNALFFWQCWGILNIHDYLTAPGTGWINTVRICQDSGGNSGDNDGSNCCVKGEAWSTCYTRLAIPGSAHDCTSPSTGRCTDGMINDIRVDPSIHPYVRYTVKNIYAINNFFLTYYQALENAAGVVSNNIEQMIQVVDVLVQPSVKMQDILLSLAVGLAFLGAPSFAASMLSLKAVALKASAQALVISTQQAPNVGRALWPAGTDKSQEIQMADLHIQLSNITGQMSDMMDQGVRLLMNDIGSFVEYADNGRYSGPNVTNTGEGTGLTVPSGTDDVAYALKTYLLSYSMWQNRWYATFDPGPFTSKADVEKRKYCKFGDGSSYCQYYDAISRQATTTVFYWSQISLRVYTLKCDGPKNAKHPGEMIDTIIHYGWAPLEVLFDGGFNCTAEGRAGSSSVNFNFDGTLDLACVSQLPIYLNCGDMCPTALVNNSCTFGDVGTLVKGACSDWDGWY